MAELKYLKHVDFETKTAHKQQVKAIYQHIAAPRKFDVKNNVCLNRETKCAWPDYSGSALVNVPVFCQISVACHQNM